MGRNPKGTRAATRHWLAPALLACWLSVALHCGASAQAAEPIVLSNTHIEAEFRVRRGTWRLVRLSRRDGTDRLEIDSDQFEVLRLDGKRFTADDYRPASAPEKMIEAGEQALRIPYARKPATHPSAPERVAITYELGGGPWLHIALAASARRGDVVDRVQVLRFSTPQRASRGGFGQPVFIGSWFFGLDYPGFYSRHSDGFTEPAFGYRIWYDIDLQGGDREFAPRPGLVTLFHFPGYARKQANGEWAIACKRAVAGVSRKSGEGAELALLDYIAATRKTPRSHLHYNNWYTFAAKDLSIESFINRTYKPIKENLAKYGVALDAMVPDHGWENSKTFTRILEPKLDDKHPPLPKLSRALAADGKTRLGIWVAFDGTNQSLARGIQVGYRPGVSDSYRNKRPWMEGKRFFNILDPKYVADLKESLRFLLADAKVDYIKHDFNHNFVSDYLSERHAREACLDLTLELLAYERGLNPNVFQNYTNGTWFTPWWLQHVDSLWLMSGDGAACLTWPMLSRLDGALSYRDRYFFESWCNPQRCPRPILPAANLMTHGIIASTKKSFLDKDDRLEDWADHCVMYFGRGTTAKELYITPEWLDADRWKALAMAARWAVTNQHRLLNTVPIGGNPARGQAYGFLSWVDGRAILTARNPDWGAQTLSVPFDHTVYFRGELGKPYHARAIYPFVEQMPWRLVSGKAFGLAIPGDSVVVYELEPGEPLTGRVLTPDPLPESRADLKQDIFELALQIPDDRSKRYDLLVQPWSVADAVVEINGRPAQPWRRMRGKGWSVAAYDLRGYRGRKLIARGRLVSSDGKPKGPKPRPVALDVWLVADRPVAARPAAERDPLPFPISQHYRRLTQHLISKKPLRISAAP